MKGSLYFDKAKVCQMKQFIFQSKLDMGQGGKLLIYSKYSSVY